MNILRVIDNYVSLEKISLINSFKLNPISLIFSNSI